MSSAINDRAPFYVQLGARAGPFVTLACPAIITDRPKTKGATKYKILCMGSWRRVFTRYDGGFGFVNIQGREVTAQ